MSDAWPWPRRIFWLVLAGLAWYVAGPLFVASFSTEPHQVRDFIQEWESARNWVRGKPVYAPIEHRDRTDPFSLEYNVHPPPSVLLALPFVELPYADAFQKWNLYSLTLFVVSVCIVVGQLDPRPTVWLLLPLLALTVVCHPLRGQISMGQLNLVLLFLLTVVWAAERRELPLLAGTALGLAAAIKLFPGFFLLYYAWRRQWSLVLGGAVSFLAVNGLSLAVLGWDAYRTYFTDILPNRSHSPSTALNVSVFGFWFRLFEPAAGKENIEPIVVSPLLARVGTVVTCAALVALLGWATRRPGPVNERDRGFALATIAMLLVTPLTWDHSLVLLLGPLAVGWHYRPDSWVWRVAFALSLSFLWIDPALVFKLCLPGEWPRQGQVSVGHSLGLVSFQFYALLALFVLGLQVLRANPNRA